jgi:hypothetical protein
MITLCPLCNLPVPANEAITYHGKHEDCALGQTKLPPGVGGIVSGMNARARKSRGSPDTGHKGNK